MAKIELIKKTDELGITYYQLEKDGRYVAGSSTLDLKVAEFSFKALTKGAKPTKEVIEEATI